MIDISICVSVHNTEKYLTRCLESLVNQTIKNIEIVLVNNGSTDRSLEIMQEYQSNYANKNIKIISQSDMGLAQGRQTGINHATGKYIGFLDADDFVELDAFERLINVAKETNADIVEGKTMRSGKIISSPYTGIKNSKDVLYQYFKNNNIPTMLWMRIFHRDLFKHNVFPNIYVNNEDIYAFPCLFHAANTVAYCDYTFHTYSTDNEMAVMNTLEKSIIDNQKIIENRNKVFDSVFFIRDFIGKEDINKYYNDVFNIFICNNAIGYCAYNVSGYSLEDKFKYVCRKLDMNKQEFNKYFHNSIRIPSTRFQKIAKIFSPYLSLKLYNFLNKKSRFNQQRRK